MGGLGSLVEALNALTECTGGVQSLDKGFQLLDHMRMADTSAKRDLVFDVRIKPPHVSVMTAYRLYDEFTWCSMLLNKR